MSSERLPNSKDGKERYLCPGCAVIISGPGYPKLHTCFRSETLTPLTKQRVAALKDIIDGQTKEIAGLAAEVSLLSKTVIELHQARPDVYEDMGDKAS